MRQAASFEHHANLCDARSDRLAVARKCFLKYQKKSARSRLISRMREGAQIQPIAMDVDTFVKVTSVINHASVGGCMLKDLVSVMGQI